MKNGLHTDAAGNKQWFKNGQLHRLDGPALIHTDGTQCWVNNNEIHRLDGPAIIYPDGTQYWYIHGLKYSYKYWLNQRIPYIVNENLNKIL